MLRATIACVLITLLTCGVIPASSQPTVAEQVASLKAGQKIKVELLSGEILKGRMDSVTADQLTMELSGQPPGSARVIRFDEVRTARHDGLSTGKKWAIFGVIWVVIGIVAKLTV
jgi:hypothetical protein